MNVLILVVHTLFLLPQVTLTQNDPVTGLPVPNELTLEDEIQISKILEPEVVASEKKLGFEVDSDGKANTRVDRILKSLIGVSHLPNLPWRAHVSSRPDWNANARMGGLVFVYKGLLDEVNDVELAGILGHEIAHVTCRHMSESVTHQKFAGLISERMRSAYYKASFTTEQEAEADKVGILYMALAGYDPRAVSALWQRRLKLVGNGRQDYLHDHPLNRERSDQTDHWGDLAAKYYRGPREVNPDFGAILVQNDLAPRLATNNETVDLISGAVLEVLKTRQTKAEAKKREELAEAEQARKQMVLGFIKIDKIQVGKGQKTKLGVFAEIRNTSNTAMKWVDVQFSYKTAAGTWEPYGNPVRLEGLPSGQMRSWGLPITDDKFARAVFGAHIVDVEY